MYPIWGFANRQRFLLFMNIKPADKHNIDHWITPIVRQPDRTWYNFFGYVCNKNYCYIDVDETFKIPFVCKFFEPHPQVQARLGFCSVDIDEPEKFSGFDMCQNVRVKSRRPNGVNDRMVETRKADLKTLFIIFDWYIEQIFLV